MKNVVTRFAPSPTGFMHIGGVRTALFAWLLARQNDGKFILRIEDTDKEREVEGSIAHIQRSLQYLNIDWDYGPNNPGSFGSCIQSERLDTYREFAQKLIDKGFAYPDPYTQEEVTTFREKAQAEKRPFLYREHRPETFGDWDGSVPLRFKVPEIKRYDWTDAVRGELSAGEESLDDFILIKSDGFPTYNFAHIVDDFNMGVTHVVRGEEFVSSTPKFLSLYDALEIPYPIFVTLPPILRDDKTKKLGKRDGAKDILDYQVEGYLPETMMNFLALIGWNPGTEQEILPKEELLKLFSIDHIQKSGGVFNEEKLLWMNKEYLSKFTTEEFFTYAKAALPASLEELPQYSEERLQRFVPNIRERIHLAKEITDTAEAGEYNWPFTAPEYKTELLKWKQDDSVQEVLPRLSNAKELLEKADFSSPETIKDSVWNFAEEVGRGQLLWPLRVAISGLEKSPDPFNCCYIVGKEEALSRVQTACDKILSNEIA